MGGGEADDVSIEKVMAPAISFEEKIGTVTIIVSADESVFPDGCSLSVRKIEKKSELKDVTQAVNADKEKNDISNNVAESFTYDIKVLKDGEEIQPDGEINVSFKSDLVNNKNLETQVYHVSEVTDKKTEETTLEATALEGEAKRDTFTAVSDGFSYYTVEFTYNDLTYVMDGDTEILLSDVLDHVGLKGEASDVKGSNDALFSFEKKGGEWYVKANKAFKTEEWMKVTIDGIVYAINVTDAITGVAYAEFDSSTGVLRIFRGTSGTYTDGQVVGTKTYWTGIEDITGNTNPKWYSKRSSVTNISIEDSFAPETAYKLFSRMSNLTSITGISNLDTSNVTNMSSMFEGCNRLTSLDVSGFNTSNVTTMYSMFYNCSTLTSLDVSGFDTCNVTTMRYMFRSCSGLTSLDLSNFDISNVTDMGQMYYDSSGLTSLDVSSFDTSNVTNMGSMFYGCSNLEEIALGPQSIFEENPPNTNWQRTKTLANVPVTNGVKITNITEYDGSEPGWYTHYSTFLVEYDANGGIGAPAAQEKEPGVDLTLTTDVPTRTGYNFYRWNTKADGSGTSYEKGAAYSVDEDVTLYAQWEPVTPLPTGITKTAPIISLCPISMLNVCPPANASESPVSALSDDPPPPQAARDSARIATIIRANNFFLIFSSIHLTC